MRKKPFYNRGLLTNTRPRTPSYPTSAMPGSVAKLEVMIQRAERGEAVFHPLDAQSSDTRSLLVAFALDAVQGRKRRGRTAGPRDTGWRKESPVLEYAE